MTVESANARRRAYLALLIFGLAFGWIEASVVIYLRDIYLLETRPSVAAQFPFVALPVRLVAVEVVREACTLLLMGAAAWMSARRWAARTGVFLLLFGIWDLTYYAVLRLIVQWPDTLFTWDILFLIPAAWASPVWAPAIVAMLFVVVGSYLFWTTDRARFYRWIDMAVVLAAALAIIAAFLANWRIVAAGGVPQRFPAWLFWAGVLAGASWFVHVERRTERR